MTPGSVLGASPVRQKCTAVGRAGLRWARDAMAAAAPCDLLQAGGPTSSSALGEVWVWGGSARGEEQQGMCFTLRVCASAVSQRAAVRHYRTLTSCDSDAQASPLRALRP